MRGESRPRGIVRRVVHCACLRTEKEASLWRAVRVHLLRYAQIFFPTLLVLTWKLEASPRPPVLPLALLSLVLLVGYGLSVMGRTAVLRALGWVVPKQGAWLWAVVAGVVASLCVFGGFACFTIRRPAA